MRDILDPRDFRLWAKVDGGGNVLSTHMVASTVTRPGPFMIDITDQVMQQTMDKYAQATDYKQHGDDAHMVAAQIDDLVKLAIDNPDKSPGVPDKVIPRDTKVPPVKNV